MTDPGTSNGCHTLAAIGDTDLHNRAARRSVLSIPLIDDTSIDEFVGQGLQRSDHGSRSFEVRSRRMSVTDRLP